jgi:hypothetical protein
VGEKLFGAPWVLCLGLLLDTAIADAADLRAVLRVGDMEIGLPNDEEPLGEDENAGPLCSLVGLVGLVGVMGFDWLSILVPLNMVPAL